MKKKINFIKNEEQLKMLNDALDMRTLRNINEIIEDVRLQNEYTMKYDCKLYLGLIDEQKERYIKISAITKTIIKLQNELEEELERAKAYIIARK